MGFFDRFKKKKKKEEPAAAAPAKEKKAAPAPEVKEAPLPTEPVPKAAELAKRFNEANVAAGKYNRARADLFNADLAAIAGSDASDDDKLVQIGQVRGGMLLAAMTVANAVKAE